MAVRLQGANIYMYSTEHAKAQPMLIHVLYEASKLDTFISKIKEAMSTTELTSIEGMRIYRYQLEYRVNPNSQSTYEDYIYITDHAKAGYLKAVHYSADYDCEAFTDEDRKQLLHHLGYSGWFVMTEPILEPILGLMATKKSTPKDAV